MAVSNERTLASPRRCSNFFLRFALLVCILALTVFISLAYPLLQAEHMQLILPGPSVKINWHKDALAVDYQVRDRENQQDLWNETFLAYAATDPNEELEKRKIKLLLEGSKADFGSARNKWTYQRGMDHYVDVGRVQNRVRPRYEPWMLQIQSPRYDSYWPRMRQLLQIWSRKRRYEPNGMEEIFGSVKKTLDSFYKMQENQPMIVHEGEERYRSCAVVGSSGILLKQKFGSFIDSHDVVIRLNNAKVVGFQESVGSKTSIAFVNSNVYHDCSRRLNCFCHPYGNIPIALYICQVQHLMDIAFCEPHHNAPVIVTDPRFDTLCTRTIKWYSVKNYVESTGKPLRSWAKDHNAIDFHYSSGLQAVMLALGICEKVDILGFGKSPEAKHHYHTNQQAELSLHDYPAEYLFYDDLALNRTSSIPFLSEAGFRLPSVTVYR